MHINIIVGLIILGAIVNQVVFVLVEAVPWMPPANTIAYPNAPIGTILGTTAQSQKCLPSESGMTRERCLWLNGYWRTTNTDCQPVRTVQLIIINTYQHTNTHTHSLFFLLLTIIFFN
jgi:hypothetical protein